MSERNHPHRAGVYDWIVFLVTGPEEKLIKFNDAACVEIFDRRKQTLRCRAFGEERGLLTYNHAVEAAKTCDVTLQDLVDTGRTVNECEMKLPHGGKAVISDCVEEYPVVYLGSDGMKWGK